MKIYKRLEHAFHTSMYAAGGAVAAALFHRWSLRTPNNLKVNTVVKLTEMWVDALRDQGILEISDRLRPCDACGDLGPQCALEEHVWDEVGDANSVCLRCVRKLLGREIRHDDLALVPGNRDVLYVLGFVAPPHTQSTH